MSKPLDDKKERLEVPSGKFIQRTERSGFELVYADGHYCRTLDPHLETDLAEMLFARSTEGPTGPAGMRLAQEVAKLRGVIREASGLLHRNWSTEGIEALDKAIAGFEAGEVGAPSSAIEDKFTLELAEELFGCHLGAAQGNGVYECAICDHDIHISGWVTAKHADDCFINRVRDYLAKHKPECVPGWSAPTDGRGAK